MLAQNLIDASSCSTSELNTNAGHRLGKDSPPSKLLSARDIPNYQQMITQYYSDISMLPSIKESDIMAYMKDVSKVSFPIRNSVFQTDCLLCLQTFEGKIQKDTAMEELLYYCLTYKDAIFAGLAAEPIAQHEHLHLKFETIIYAALQNANTQQYQQNTTTHQQTMLYVPSTQPPTSNISRV